MSVRQITGIRAWGGLPGLILVVLALVSQVALGAVVLPDEAGGAAQAVAALEAVAVYCDSSAPAVPGQEPAHRHQGPERAICPLSVALALPAVILTAGPDLPRPARRVVERVELPPAARAPPPPLHARPQPRGPPVLS